VPISCDDTPLLQGPVRIFSRCCARTLRFRSRLYDLSSPEDLGTAQNKRHLGNSRLQQIKRPRRRWPPSRDRWFESASLQRRVRCEAYRIERFGSIDGIVLRSSEAPRPRPKEILMRVRASSLNYRDLMVLKGGGRGPTKLGVVPLFDGAGEVAAIGDGITRAKLGDRIAGCLHLITYIEGTPFEATVYQLGNPVCHHPPRRIRLRQLRG